MAYLQGYSRQSSVISSPLEYVPSQQFALPGGFEVTPEEVELTHAPSGVQLGGSQRLADSAFASWRSGTAPSASLTSGLSLSTRSSDVDLKEFLVQRGRHPLQGLHKAAAQGDRIGIINIMKQLGPDAPIDDLDANGCTPLMYAVMSESRLAIEMLLNFSARREQVDSEGRTAVHYAAFFGKHKSLKFLIDTASDWISRDLYGRTPLHWACSSKSTRCLAILLKHAQMVMGNINPIDGEGMTPIHCAAQFGRPRNIQLLTEAGCDLTAVDIDEKTALHWTANNRDPSCVQALLDAYPPLLNRQDNSGSTLLHLAASIGSIHIVDTLLRMAGVDIDMRDNAERTPLHCCSQGGHAEIVQLLLTFGALDSCIDFQGFTALHYAVQNNSVACVNAFTQVAAMSHLPEANEGKNPLMIAAQNASHSIMKILLQSTSALKTINHADTDGKTALHLACECGSEECTTLLLSYGVDPNPVDHMSQTPLMTVCIAGHTACIHPLIAGGANAQLMDSEGHTPLLKAVLYGQVSAVQSLILAGVNLDIQDSTGTTAIHMAAYSGAGIILNMLLENGASPNIQDLNGLTALHMAAVEGHTYCVTALVNHRANLNTTDFSDERLTPLDYAVQNGHGECADELKACGAVTVSTIRDMAAICIQTIFRGYRARRLKATLKIQTKAVTVIAAHVRRFLQKKRYTEMKKQHYAAITIQSFFRGYQQRVLFHIKQAERLELEKKQKTVECFAQLVLKHKLTQQPFPSKPPDREVPSQDQLVNERESRLEAAMKMREIYEEKQRWWEKFRAEEKQRRIDKARQAELDHLTAVIAQSRARREYSQAKISQSLTVRSYHHAAVVIQRAFRAMKSRRWWQEKEQARFESEQRMRQNKAARKIQRAWKIYRQYKIYQATHYRSVYTSPVVNLSNPKAMTWTGSGPSHKRDTSITGYPRRKVHQTLRGGFRVPRLRLQSPSGDPLYSSLPSSLLLPLTTQNMSKGISPGKQVLRQCSSTSPNVKIPTYSKENRALPELSTRVSLLTKTKPSTAPVKQPAFHLPQIVPNYSA